MTISAGGAAGVGYYCGGGGSSTAPNYYIGAVGTVDPPGHWSGAFAEQLGLTGVVDGPTMEAVFDRFQTLDGQAIGSAPRNYTSIEDRIEAALARIDSPLPEDVARIRSQVERDTRSTSRGVDLTYAPAKSVTVAHTAAWRAAIESIRSGTHDRSIEFESIRSGFEDALLAANQAILDHMASVATTRQGAGYGHAQTWVPVDGLAVASFLQHTSRSDDPQLHVHNVILNRAARSSDGAVRALDTADLVGHKMEASAIGERVLAERLADMGIHTAVRPDGVAREVVGVDEEAMALFSQRSQALQAVARPAIAAAEERLGRELTDLERSRINQWANLSTRDAKTKGLDVDALLDRWQERITDELGTGLVPTAERIAAAVAGGPVERDGSFSPSAVIAEALERVSVDKASWTRGDLMVEIDLALPLLGLSQDDAADLIGRLTDTALTTQGVVQVAGNTGVRPPSDLVAGSYVRGSAARYAAPTTLAAERAIREAAVEHRGHVVDADAVHEWLSEHYGTVGDDQRAAVVGLASRDSALAQLVGPAGTGKSYTAGALAGAWGDLSDGGRVVGLAVSQPAANILRDDGVTVTANLAAWQASQSRLENGNPNEADLERAIGPRDLIVMDEASMTDTGVVSHVLDVAGSIGARVVVMGDHHQLGAIGAGGAMGLIEGRGDTYTLTDVRRFAEEWERSASLGVREGDATALAEYDRHGRLVDCLNMDAAVSQAARAAAAEWLAGRSCSVVADTNADAHRIANEVREHLVAAGVVEADGVQLGRTGGVAGLGDTVLTRQIDWSLGVLNGSAFTVVGTGDDGSLSVVDAAGRSVQLPANYVAEHVQHAYASTVHVAQGSTVDVGYFVTDGSSTSEAAYVALTRGRDRNTAFVAVSPSVPAQGRLDATVGGGQVKVEDPATRSSAWAVLADSLERDTAKRAALVEQEIDTRTLGSMSTILGQIEHGTDRACRARLDDDLDTLVHDGVLSEAERAALASDQSTEHLSRVCRAVEQAGHDPSVALRAAIEDRPLEGARSVAQVVAGRIAADHDVSGTVTATSAVPAGLPTEWASYLEQLHDQAGERAAELGAQVAQGAAVWAVRDLGPVPQDAIERLEWEQRAGAVAAYREAAGYDDESRALPSQPGISQTEARGAWWEAWDALGRPEETRPEAALSDGALQARATAWEREQEWAPAHADASLKAAELDADEARREAVLARAAGDDERADELEAEAEQRAAIARGMAQVADARGEWAANTAVTRDLAERAAEELGARGLARGEEPDRVSAQEWLEHQREADARDEAVRDVTELDVPLVELQAGDDADAALESQADVETSEAAGVDLRGADLRGGGADTEHGAADEATPEDVVPEGDAHDATSAGADGATAPRDEVDPVHDVAPSEGDAPTGDSGARAGRPEADVSGAPLAPSDDAADATPADEPGAAESQNRSGPAHREAPIEPSDVELSVLVHVAEQAQDRVADRESEEAAHGAWEAEHDAYAEHDDGGDGAEAGGSAAYAEAYA